jgi:Zn-finger nucleic acid-binding protein
MKCPICTPVDLLMTERRGVEIDYCPQCRGIWLDKGELDKIIEQSSQEGNRSYSEDDSDKVRHLNKRNEDYQDDDYDDYNKEKKYDKNGKPIKRRGGLSDIFGDIFG